MFFRFLFTFGLLALLFVGGLAILAFLLTRLFDGGGETAVLVWIGGCSLSLALPIVAIILAGRTFRGIASPLGDMTAAADELAKGDLSVRVPEGGTGEFNRLARTFNNMAAELELADQTRRNLTADVAHELRNPLHILQGNLEGLIEGVYEPDPEQYNAMLDEVRALSRLVEDLLTLSRAETGDLALVLETVQITDLLADVETSFSGLAASAGVTLQRSGGTGLAIHADAGRLDQVLSNLVINALRYTQPGGAITLAAEPTPDGLRLRVSDTGAGIPPEDLPFIFDRFWRGDPSRSHTKGAGAGLGLAIARQLVQAHEGLIHVESEPGQGTTFTIDLPDSGIENKPTE